MANEIEQMMQKFFVQLIPPTFLCITTGPCKSVSQSYAGCLQSNSPFWRAFFGTEPSKINTILWQTIMKYRLLGANIEKLHRLGNSHTLKSYCTNSTLKLLPNSCMKTGRNANEDIIFFSKKLYFYQIMVNDSIRYCKISTKYSQKEN